MNCMDTNVLISVSYTMVPGTHLFRRPYFECIYYHLTYRHTNPPVNQCLGLVVFRLVHKLRHQYPKTSGKVYWTFRWAAELSVRLSRGCALV